MAAGLALAASQAVFRISSTIVLYQSEWEVDPNAMMLEITNAEGGGFKDRIRGLRDISISVRGWVDVGANIHEGTLGLVDGATLINVEAHLSTLISPFWSLPKAILERIRCTARVDDLYRYDATIHGKGQFIYPIGNLV